jgi:hypothetical protein
MTEYQILRLPTFCLRPLMLASSLHGDGCIGKGRIDHMNSFVIEMNHAEKESNAT